MVLTRKEILTRVYNQRQYKHPFIEPLSEENIQSASYDLTLGSEYYICSESDVPDIKHLEEGENLKVPPRATFFVISREKLYIPLDLCASVSLAFGLIKKGIIFAVQPPIDPGYHGAIVALMHNMSDEEIILEQGRHILNVVYNQLSEAVPENAAYQGAYDDITLKKFCTEAVRHSAIVKLTDEAKEASKKAEEASKEAKDAAVAAERASHKTLSNIITIITAVLALLTILITVITVILSMKTVQSTPDPPALQTVYEEEAQHNSDNDPMQAGE